MKSDEIRERFLKYFERNGHSIVSSSPLVPGNDPTLLFTNAGMVQFKDVFLGHDKRSYTRATTSQRCVRAGGKHNDLENVGYTARHHTFFEMLGNFSFGQYFKEDAIRYAWDLLTDEFGLDPNRMWVTVYETDDEAYEIWANDIKIPPERIVRIGDKPGGQKYQSDNFWQMGDTGPCGPCSEIFWDHGADVEGGPPGSDNEDGDRFIEIWNLVFMQFNRDESGVMKPLPKPSVDTGMGLERMAAVLQKVHSNYEIDIFQTLINGVVRETGCKDFGNASLRVIADHIRSCAFLIVDGVIPSNEGRGYVLRRIIRRAIRHGYKLGQSKPFFYNLVVDLIDVMGAAYPELTAAQQQVSEVLFEEERRFAETLEKGMAVLESALLREDKVLDGETVFRLYDTFGFPVDLTADIARERNIQIDLSGFEAAMEEQRQRARAASKFQSTQSIEYEGGNTQFHGYDSLVTSSKIIALYKEGSLVNRLVKGDKGIVVLDKTTFYAESGGQVGDRGCIATEASPHSTFLVMDTQKIQAEVFGHHGDVSSGELNIGDSVSTEVDAALRTATMFNHSATHLLHAALREVLGNHVQQKGSLVDENRTRFDFSHPQPITPPQLEEIERVVNTIIRTNASVNARVMGYDQAIDTGAVALFGEKYGDEVRVIEMGEFSTELCGGTHVKRTGDIGLFKIITESGIASGVRRIEASTGQQALDYIHRREKQFADISSLLKVAPDETATRLSQMLDNIKRLEKEVARVKSKMASGQGEDIVAKAKTVNGVTMLATVLPDSDVALLRQTVDQLKAKLKSAVILLASVNGEKVILIAGVTNDLTDKFKAGELVNYVANQVGGKGGGRPDLAQAGGTNPDTLNTAIDSVSGWISERAN
ncbi:MAG: alanine--tRNA ligase [Proteobacteria bacterium]|nr:alanine--tRNA ligase [Pseudomonadota bacterium]MDA0862303.1 alanine--tRNA ligase [Pseudomonadota bacterium]MDA1030609.1 alanine--tRNA ligase [Pseudomonadota bacterium]